MKPNKSMILFAAALAVAFASAQLDVALADIVQKELHSGQLGISSNGTILAESGSVVYARHGSNVQVWPGSKLVPAASAANIPDCSNPQVQVSGTEEELVVKDGATACTIGDTAVVATVDSTVIYDADVPLIPRPVHHHR